MNYLVMNSPLGQILVVGDDAGLSAVSLLDGALPMEVDITWFREEHPVLKAAREQLEEYFEGKRDTFDLLLNPKGTAFQKKVWAELIKIPMGTTIDYGTLATRIGNPKASRAVGAANGKNPIAIIVPCHRVIGRSGKLTGYAGGLDMKERLLKMEQGYNSEPLSNAC